MSNIFFFFVFTHYFALKKHIYFITVMHLYIYLLFGHFSFQMSLFL